MSVKRAVMTALHRGRRLVGRVTGLRTPSVQAIVITPGGRLVMVRHTYMPGWHFPGGGLRRGESPDDGILRELREEIGLTQWGAILRIEIHAAAPPMFVFTDAEYRFRSNLEIDRVAEFALDAPMRPSQRAMVDRWRALQNAVPLDSAAAKCVGLNRAG